MKKNKPLYISSLIMFAFIILVVPFSAFLYQKTLGEIIRIVAFIAFFDFGLLFIYHYSFHFKKMDYDNAEHPYRFMYTLIIGVSLSLIFPLIDKKAWIFVSIGIAVALFSNAIIGFFSVSGLIMISVLLSPNTDIFAFMVYLFASFIGILVFQDIDKSFKVGPSIFITVLVMVILEIAGFVLLENVELSAEQFIMPIFNIVINILFLIFILKYFNQVIANKYRNKYLELNDQEYKELIRLKERSKSEYYRSIHTAYLAERIAAAVGCDVDVTKNCAYYHRIKKVYNLTEEQCVIFVNDNDFPPNAKKLLLDFLDKETKIITKEAAIVYISDRLISSLMNIFSKDKNIKIDYLALIDALLNKEFYDEKLSDSDLSLKDMKILKEILKKEVLYYDFLR